MHAPAAPDYRIPNQNPGSPDKACRWRRVPERAADTAMFSMFFYCKPRPVPDGRTYAQFCRRVWRFKVGPSIRTLRTFRRHLPFCRFGATNS